VDRHLECWQRLSGGPPVLTTPAWTDALKQTIMSR
jgi:hypothetical protein